MMKQTAQKMLIGLFVFAVFALAGCSSFYVVDRTMTLQEIVSMA